MKRILKTNILCFKCGEILRPLPLSPSYILYRSTKIKFPPSSLCLRASFLFSFFTRIRAFFDHQVKRKKIPSKRSHAKGRTRADRRRCSASSCLLPGSKKRLMATLGSFHPRACLATAVGAVAVGRSVTRRPA